MATTKEPKPREQKPKAVTLSPELRLCTDFLQELRLCDEEETDVIGVQFEKTTLGAQDVGGCNFEDVWFHGCSFEETDFTRCSFRNVRFEQCAFVTCKFDSTWLQQCELTGSRFQGCSFTEARLMDVTMTDSSLRYANLTAAVLDRCAATGCDFSDAFFAQCRCKQLRFDRSQFARTEFYRTPLAGLDFTTSVFEGVRVSEDGSELRGAVVTTPQAAGLARLLGVVVKDD